VTKAQSFTDREYLLTSSILINSLQHMMSMSRKIPWVPKIIHNLSIGDYILFSIYGEFSMTEYDPDFSLGTYFSTICKEERHLASAASSSPLADAEAHRTITLHFQRDAENIAATCGIWNLKPAGEIGIQAVTSAIPTLIFEGEFDPITPTEWGKSVAEGLSSAYSAEFPGMGHGVLGTDRDGCSNQIAGAFLESPHQAPDTSCTGDIAVNFAVKN
jgi:pimeloyl-ACP methyl ester carboxylesterase